MVWQMWAAWEPVWIRPWGWVLGIMGVMLVWRASWKVKLLPWALTYVLLTQINYDYSAQNFGLSPVTISSLLAFMTFLVFCALEEPAVAWAGILWTPVYKPVLGALGVLAACSATYVLFRPWGVQPGHMMPIFWNSSVGASFAFLALAATPLWFVGVYTVMAMHRFCPVLVVAVYYACLRPKWWKLAAMAACAAAVYHLNPSGSGRTVFWGEYWSFWVALSWNVKLFGTHLGTTAALLPLVQARAGGAGEYYIWLHNDIFQALTELGVIGFVVCTGSLVEIMARAPREDRAMGAALAVFMAFNYPWHWMPEALLYWDWIKRNATTSK